MAITSIAFDTESFTSVPGTVRSEIHSNFPLFSYIIGSKVKTSFCVDQLLSLTLYQVLVNVYGKETCFVKAELQLILTNLPIIATDVVEELID